MGFRFNRAIKKSKKLLNLRVRLWLCIAGICCIAVIFWFARLRCVQHKEDEFISHAENSNYQTINGLVQHGESLYQIIVANGGSEVDGVRIGQALQSYYDPRQIQEGDQYQIAVSTSATIIRFMLMPNLFDRFIVERQQETFSARKEKIKINTSWSVVSGLVKSNLYESMIEKGIPPEIIVNFAEIFSWQIDFFNDTRDNDSYWIVWETMQTETGHMLSGKILGGQYQGKTTGSICGIYFEHRNGEGGYYDGDGTSLRKYFLRAPLTYRRISSYFSQSRFHPILRYYRPHLGIDYAAPTGTPVSTIGDGVVIHRGWKGQAGNTVIIRHNAVYESQYGHLSRYAKGLCVGARVKQGEVIGYVGATGLATGPHLDFRLKKKGTLVNFLKLKLPPAEKITPEDMPLFHQKEKEVFKKVSENKYMVGSQKL